RFVGLGSDRRDALQWGRLPKEAETSPCWPRCQEQFASMGPPPEGGGDGSRRSARRRCERLQWGRLPKEAETSVASMRGNVERCASMGPPPEGGGDPITS